MSRILAIDHVQLAMPEGGEAAAVAFYAGVLGVPQVPKPEPLAARGGCWFEDGDVRIHLGVEADFHPARKAHPALVVDDVEALARDLEGAGHAVRREVNDQLYVDDPFGNRIELVSRRP